jgi:hypothetical protein
MRLFSSLVVFRTDQTRHELPEPERHLAEGLAAAASEELEGQLVEVGGGQFAVYREARPEATKDLSEA